MKLLCLDSNSILNRAFYGVKLLTTSDGTYTNAIYGFLNILQKLLNDVNPDAVACAFDLKAPTFRHKMYDGYKAQRKGMPEELAQQLPIIKELLQDMGYRIITMEGYEADDILGTLSVKCEQEGHDCFMPPPNRPVWVPTRTKTTIPAVSSAPPPMASQTRGRRHQDSDRACRLSCRRSSFRCRFSRFFSACISSGVCRGPSRLFFSSLSACRSSL